MPQSPARRTRRPYSRTAAIAAALVTLCPLAACGGGDDAKSDGGMDTVKVTISQWPTAPYAATYMVGMEKGFFSDEHIKIDGVVAGSGGGTTVRSLTSGGLDFGVVSVSSLISAAIAGAPLKILATENGSIANQMWVTRPDSPYHSLKDFCGKGVWGITSPGSTTEGTTALMLKKDGIDPKCVKTTAGGGLSEQLTLLKSGQIDSAIIWEPVLAQELAKGTVRELVAPAKELPLYTQTVIVTGSQLINENPDLVNRFLTAHRKAQDWLIAHPEDAGKIYAKQAGVNEKDAVTGITRLSKEPDYFTENLSVTGLTTVVDGMEAVGQDVAKQGIPWKDIVDQQFLPESARIDVGKLPAQAKAGS